MYIESLILKETNLNICPLNGVWWKMTFCPKTDLSEVIESRYLKADWSNLSWLAGWRCGPNFGKKAGGICYSTPTVCSLFK